MAYAQRAQLDRGAHSPTHILLDTTMCDALFKVRTEVCSMFGCIFEVTAEPGRPRADADCAGHDDV